MKKGAHSLQAFSNSSNCSERIVCFPLHRLHCLFPLNPVASQSGHLIDFIHTRGSDLVEPPLSVHVASVMVNDRNRIFFPETSSRRDFFVNVVLVASRKYCLGLQRTPRLSRDSRTRAPVLGGFSEVICSFLGALALRYLETVLPFDWYTVQPSGSSNLNRLNSGLLFRPLRTSMFSYHLMWANEAWARGRPAAAKSAIFRDIVGFMVFVVGAT